MNARDKLRSNGMKWTLRILTALLMTWSVGLNAQSRTVSEEEWRLIGKAMIDAELDAERVRALTEQLRLADEQFTAQKEARRAERQVLLETKKAYLASLIALSEYRTKRRPTIVKVLTVGIVRDKRDKRLEADIADLEREIKEWRP